eukprot:scaffold309020_cov39-Tisochrysis_lutea.AAC.2
MPAQLWRMKALARCSRGKRSCVRPYCRTSSALSRLMISSRSTASRQSERSGGTPRSPTIASWGEGEREVTR